MGLMNKLFGKRDYAQEFQDAFINAQIIEWSTILSDWHKHTNQILI